VFQQDGAPALCNHETVNCYVERSQSLFSSYLYSVDHRIWTTIHSTFTIETSRALTYWNRGWFGSGAVLAMMLSTCLLINDHWCKGLVACIHAFVQRVLISITPCKLAHSDLTWHCSVWLACSNTPYFVVKIYTKCTTFYDSVEMQLRWDDGILLQIYAVLIISGRNDEEIVEIGARQLKDCKNKNGPVFMGHGV